jgi:hypothetical protein
LLCDSSSKHNMDKAIILSLLFWKINNWIQSIDW